MQNASIPARKKVLSFILSILVVAVLSLSAASCMFDHDDWRMTAGRDVVLTLAVPASSGTHSTRASGQWDESRTDEIDILAFEAAPDGETFLYHICGTDISGEANSSGKRFTAMLRHSRNGESQRIVVLANLRSETDAVKGQFVRGMAKEEILRLIKFDSGSEWNTSPDRWSPLPMWGESPDAVVVTEETAGGDFGTIGMSRAVARVDVGLNITDNRAEGFGDIFSMTDIRVYNSRNKGLASPAPGNLGSGGYAVRPTIPSDSGSNLPLAWSLGDEGGLGLSRAIYLSESDNNNAPGREHQTCLLIGGYYTTPGSPELNRTEKTWYRVDFINPSPAPGEGTLYDLLRNHCYVFNIRGVTGPGYSTEEEAFDSFAVNMDARLITWNNPNINDFVFDGQYMLGVDDRRITLGEDSPENQSFGIYTDYPPGWSAVATDSPQSGGSAVAWLTVATAEGGPGEGTFEYIAERNTTSAERYAYLHITAGRLTLVVTVVQSVQSENMLDVDPGHEIVFGPQGAVHNRQTYQVTANWCPASNPVTIIARDITATGVPVTVDGHLPPYTITEPDGNEVIDICLDDSSGNSANDNVRDRLTRLDFVMDCGSHNITRSVYVRQTGSGISVEAASDYHNIYPLMGTRQKVMVYSSGPWEATLTTSGAIYRFDGDSTTASGQGSSDGEELWFTMQTGYNSPLFLPGTSVIRFSSPGGIFETFDYTLKGWFGYPYSATQGGVTSYYIAYESDSSANVNEQSSISRACNGYGKGWMVPAIEVLAGMYNELAYDADMRHRHDFVETVYRSISPGEGASNYHIDFRTGAQNHGWFVQNSKVRCVKEIEP